jgi:hypothetical protein
MLRLTLALDDFNLIEKLDKPLPAEEYTID